MTGRLTDENAGFVQSLTRHEFEQFCTIVQKKYKIVPFVITWPLNIAGGWSIFAPLPRPAENKDASI